VSAIDRQPLLNDLNHLQDDFERGSAMYDGLELAIIQVELQPESAGAETAEAELADLGADFDSEHAMRLQAEAELAALRAQYDACQKTCLQRDALIDELDEMKARRCWTCRGHRNLTHGGHSYCTNFEVTCPMFGRMFEADGFCHRWAKREDGGS
jgi:hypothetical protein